MARSTPPAHSRARVRLIVAWLALVAAISIWHIRRGGRAVTTVDVTSETRASVAAP